LAASNEILHGKFAFLYITNMRKAFLLLLYALSGCNDSKERAIASAEEAEAKFEKSELILDCHAYR
jgi:hypothetical protein